MAQKEYSINERLDLLKEATYFYETLCEKDKRLTNKYKVLKISKQIIDDELNGKENKQLTQEELNSIVRWIVEAVTQEENLNSNKHEDEDKERIKAWLWELIWIINWDYKFIQALKEFMKSIKELTFIEENREQEIQKITNALSKNFNNKIIEK